MKILVFDNYDSFTYNLVHLVEKITGEKVDVYRNDKLPLEDVNKYDKIILSPGPGIPSEAGLLLPLINAYASSKSILGVCLGHQAIGEAFGGTLVNLSTVYHGVATMIETRDYRLETGGKTENDSGLQSPVSSLQSPVSGLSIFDGLPSKIEVGRYHSWVISDINFPDELDITARDEHNYIMALQHKKYDITGVQFHPESVLTPDGEKMMRNWLKK
jgi:anthranilate synthase component II